MNCTPFLLHSTTGYLLIRLSSVVLLSLQKFSEFQMECMAHIYHTSSLPGSSLHVYGDLRLVQKEALGHRGTDTRFNVSLEVFYCINLSWLQENVSHQKDGSRGP